MLPAVINTSRCESRALKKRRAEERVTVIVRFKDTARGQKLEKAFNRLAALAGLGQTATNVGAGLGQNTAARVGNFLADQGLARASGFVGGSNAVTDSINNLLLLNALRG